MAALRAHVLDVVDTALAVQLTAAATCSWATRARSSRRSPRARATSIDVPVAGRTHGMFAEPTTFGAKFALFCLQADRDRVRLERAREGIAVGKLSGAVGTYSANDPAIEALRLRRARADAGARHPGHRAGPPRRGPLRLRGGGEHRRGVRDRGAAALAQRRRRGRRAVRRGPEGVVVDAPQAQPRERRAAVWPRARHPRVPRRGPGRRGAVARARHLAQLGRARRPARRHPAHRVPPARRRDARKRARALPRARRESTST